MDDFINIAIPTSRNQLDHLANAMGRGIHDVFPTSLKEAGDPMAFNKMERGEYDTRKDILGFNFDSVKLTLWLKTPNARRY